MKRQEQGPEHHTKADICGSWHVSAQLKQSCMGRLRSMKTLICNTCCLELRQPPDIPWTCWHPQYGEACFAFCPIFFVCGCALPAADRQHCLCGCGREHRGSSCHSLGPIESPVTAGRCFYCVLHTFWGVGAGHGVSIHPDCILEGRAPHSPCIFLAHGARATIQGTRYDGQSRCQCSSSQVIDICPIITSSGHGPYHLLSAAPTSPASIKTLFSP